MLNRPAATLAGQDCECELVGPEDSELLKNLLTYMYDGLRRAPSWTPNLHLGITA